jgi:ATP-dependent RNA helicase DeaD
MYHARLPEPEELDASSAPPPRPQRMDDRRPDDRRERPEPRQYSPRPDAPQAAREGMVVFRMNIGRNANADPRWMIPVICRRGGITKNEIGAIRIMDTETQFEIVERAAEQFAAEARKPDAKDPNIRFATLNEAITPAAESDMLTEAPARRYDNARPFRKKFQGQDGKPSYKGNADFKAKPGEFKGKPGFKGKSSFKSKPGFTPNAEAAPKPEGKGKLFLKGAGPGDRPLIKKRRDKPAKS